MMLLGHIGFTAFIATMLYTPVLAAVFGVLLPDIIDKGFAILGVFPCSRFLAHTVFFFPVAGLVTYIITRNKTLAVAVMLGVVLHLVQDFRNNLPLLYPFVNYPWLQTCGYFSVALGWYEILTDIIGAGLLIFTLGYRKRMLLIRERFWGMLRKTGR